MGVAVGTRGAKGGPRAMMTLRCASLVHSSSTSERTMAPPAGLKRLPLAMKPVASACPTPIKVSDTSLARSLQAPRSSLAETTSRQIRWPAAPRELAAKRRRRA